MKEEMQWIWSDLWSDRSRSDFKKNKKRICSLKKHKSRSDDSLSSFFLTGFLLCEENIDALNVSLRVCAASEEVEVVFGEERPREVVVSIAVCLTLRRDKCGSTYSPHK